MSIIIKITLGAHSNILTNAIADENLNVDNKLIAECAKLILPDSIEIRPGRDVNSFLKKILTKVVGVS